MAKIKSAVGLQIGNKAVEIVELRDVAGRIEVAAYARAEIKETDGGTSSPIGTIGIGTPSPIPGAISEAAELSKITSKEVITALPSKDTTIRYFQMPMAPVRQRETAVRYEARRYIPYKVEDLITGMIIREDRKATPKMNVLFVGVKREQVNFTIAMLNRAGKQPAIIDTVPFALLRLFLHTNQLDSKLDTAIVNVNDDNTVSVYITKDEIPYLVRDIALEGEEDALKKVGDELEVSIDYYKRQFKAEKIFKVLLAGEGDISTWAASLSERLAIPVEAADLTRSFRGKADLPLGACTAVGMALAGIRKSKVGEINLLPTALIPQKEDIVPLVIFQSIVLAVSLAVMQAIASIGLTILEKDVKNQEANRPKVSKEIANLSTPELAQISSTYEARLPMLKALVADRVFLTSKLNQLVKLVPDDMKLTEMECHEFLAVPESGEAVYPRKISRSMTIKGAVSGPTRRSEIASVDKLLSGLKGDAEFFKGFSEITLRSTRVERSGNIEVTVYELVCELKD